MRRIEEVVPKVPKDLPETEEFIVGLVKEARQVFDAKSVQEEKFPLRGYI